MTKIAIVTGGSRGIGRGCVRHLAQEGYRVYFNYAHNPTPAEELEQEMLDRNAFVQAGQVDVRDFDAVKAWIEGIRQAEGRVDVLINNAGIIADKALMLMGPDDWQKVIDTNLNGMFNVSRACIVTFLKQKAGDIINISSVSGVLGLPRQTNYSASKGGMNAFTRSLAKEVAGYGVRVNSISPGYIETDLLAGFTEKQMAEIHAKIPLRRLGQVSDVIGCVAFLLSPWAQYIVGQNMIVDGGLAI
jgi:3-oxoacyl-[acyl-carrier protein] reductase